VENPRFASHLPPGKLLDWAWEHHPGKRQQFHATPGVDAVQRVWSDLTDEEIFKIADTSDDPRVLEWLAANGIRRSGVRSALVRNPALPYETLLGIVERGTNATERDGIAKTRSAAELCALLLAGHSMSGNGRDLVTWIVGGGAQLPEDAFREIVGAVEDDHQSTVIAEILRTDPTTNPFPLEVVLERIAEHAGVELQENSWRSLGRHLASRGTARQIKQALAASPSASLRAVLVENRKITLAQAFTRMHDDHRGAILRQIVFSDERRITVEEAPLVAELAEAIGATSTASRVLLHGLKYEPAAAAWFVENTHPAIGGTVAWYTDSDAALLSVLRRNPASHQLAGAHIWRVGRIWERLSTRTRTSIVETFDGVLLSNLAPGPVRDWIVTSGPVTAVNGLLLKKTEQRTLMDRVEKERDPELAWVAAKIAERPKDRIRMAEIGLLATNWETGLKQWLRGASSGEITKLWATAGLAKSTELSRLLVATLRASDETSWLDRLISELRLEWQTAPAPVQEAAAHWLAARCGNDPDTWAAIWSLYSEWTGTLPELVEAAANI